MTLIREQLQEAQLRWSGSSTVEWEHETNNMAGNQSEMRRPSIGRRGLGSWQGEGGLAKRTRK